MKFLREKDFLDCIDAQDVPDINVGNISKKTSQLAIFDFRAFLNLSMVMVKSPTAKTLRRIMLDIVIDTINQKAGGSTKYINQLDQDFIGAFYGKRIIVGNLQMLCEIMFLWVMRNIVFIPIIIPVDDYDATIMPKSTGYI